MSSDETRRIVASWLADLGRLTAGNLSLPDAKAKLAAYADMLAERFPPTAFTRDSLEAVASANKFFPSYGEVVEPLAAWWKEHRPVPLGIGRDQSASAEQAERERKDAESWRGITAGEVRAKIRALDGHPFRTMFGSILATALRRHATEHLGLLPPEFLDERRAA